VHKRFLDCRSLVCKTEITYNYKTRIHTYTHAYTDMRTKSELSILVFSLAVCIE